MKITFDDYKKFLKECQTHFKCSEVQAKKIARQVAKKAKQRKIIFTILYYGFFGAMGLLISILVYFSPQLSFITKLVIQTGLFCFIIFFGWLIEDIHSHYPTADYRGISLDQIEKCIH